MIRSCHRCRQSIFTRDGLPFSVQEFLSAIPELPRELLRPNLKKAVEVAVRDKILAETARRLGWQTTRSSGKNCTVRK